MSIQNHLVNIDGSYHSIKTLLVNINGSWHPSTDILSNVNGIWKHLLHTVALPSVSNTSIAYTGGAVGPTISYDTTYVDVSGTTSATSVGTYTITFTLKNNCIWSDGTTAPKSYTWSIKQVYTYNKTAHVWKKYNRASTPAYEIVESEAEALGGLLANQGTIKIYDSAEASDDGTIVGVGLQSTWSPEAEAFGVYVFEGNCLERTRYANPWYKVKFAGGLSANTTITHLSVEQSGYNYTQGSTYYGTVTSDSRSTYPDNSYSGSYWYVYQGIQTVSTVKSEYQLIEGTSTTLSIQGYTTMTGYDSVYVDTSGNIVGNMSYSGRWDSNYSTFKSTYPYIYYNSAWYRVTAATSSKATVVPLSTSKG